MVTVPNSSSTTPTPQNPHPHSPPYPSTPLEERQSFRHAYAHSFNGPTSTDKPLPRPPVATEEEVDDWEKDDEEEEDWENVRKPDEGGASLGKRLPAPLPESLRVGTPHAGQQPRASSQERAHSQERARDHRLHPMASTMSFVSELNASELNLYNGSDLSSTISLPQTTAQQLQTFQSMQAQQQIPEEQPEEETPPQVSPIRTRTPYSSVAMQSHNPFLRRPSNPSNPSTGHSIFGTDPALNTWQPTSSPIAHMQTAPVELPATHTPVELPATHTPNEELSNMRLESPHHNTYSPGQDAPIPVLSEIDNIAPEFVSQPLPPASLTTRPHRDNSIASSGYNVGMDISFMDAGTSRGHRLSDTVETPQTRTWQEQQDWEREQRERRQLEAEQAMLRAQEAERLRLAEEEFHRGEAAHRAQEDTPPPPQPPRPTTQQSEIRSSAATRRNIPEHYSIKQVRWYDASAGELHTSPILTQNANGPCPLLALVNALVLSTPPNVSSSLIESLRTREQVSLALLLDAVFDELMSGRRSTGDQELPDVSELYDFLKALHTGMNVNPRFVQDVSRSHAPRNALGEFEGTKEMRLYSTFHVPLVHGWLPVLESPEYRSFARSAQTYEDAQNIQFHEEELEERLGTVGLDPTQQDLFEDLHTIKNFLSIWPTQLTEYGLQTLHEHIPRGGFAILFRNDHFSTLYKEPKANQLMTLVTDQGYASHEEIVWENLVDVSGTASELFSGDFRPVSHTSTHAAGAGRGGPSAGPRNSSLAGVQNIQSMLDVGDGADWQTVQNGTRRPNTGRNTSAASHMSTNAFATLDDDDEMGGRIAGGHGRTVSRSEQEDHDLALALQLQEEEEERVRQRNLEREREDRLTSELLDGGSAPTGLRPAGFGAAGRGTGRGGTGGSGRGSAPISVPVSGSSPSSSNNNVGRPPIPPRRTQGNAAGGAGRGGGAANTTHRPAEDGDEPPPPSYEQAAGRPAFVPPEGHPANPLAPLPGTDGPPGSSSGGPAGGGPTAAVPQGGYRPPSQAGMGRGYSLGMGRGGMMAGGRDDRDRCVMM